MPKETFRDRSGMYDIQVSWATDQDVQVGIATNDGRPVIEWLTPPPQAQTTSTTSAAPFTSLWGSLGREDINRLIRVLRRARDSAYGADA